MMYKRFTARMNLSAILHANYFLLPIVHRFDIHYGIGDATVSEICANRGIDEEFFIEILNVYNDPSYFPEAELRKSDIRLIIDYLGKTHSYYINYLLPNISKQIHMLVLSGGATNKSLRPVASLFMEYAREFQKHIEHEEEQVFPYALAVAESFLARSAARQPVKKRVGSIRKIEDEHTMMDEKLFDLKNLLIKYIEYPFDVHTCNSIIFEINRLEQDVRDHARIEDRVLFTRIEQMEIELRGGKRK
jgi:regulator of cell morphogenesis and NO signaling